MTTAKRASRPIKELTVLRERVARLERENRLLMMSVRRSPGLLYEEIRYRLVRADRLFKEVTNPEVKNLATALATADRFNAAPNKWPMSRYPEDGPVVVQRGVLTWDREPLESA